MLNKQFIWLVCRHNLINSSYEYQFGWVLW
jgi:hypothetical protein